MRRVIAVIAYGLAGMLVTGVLTAGAWALAGKDISQPTPPTPPLAVAHPSPKPTEPISSGREDRSQEVASPSGSSDEHGGSLDQGRSGASATPSQDRSGTPDGVGSIGVSDSSADGHTGSYDEGGDD
ncbi:MAG TPA: hypothetical protein VE646_14365 [Actinomycetota bacterium]|jgi:hypothetical protein|nr:hypothetical protein [Actinomycetota bacterium]